MTEEDKYALKEFRNGVAFAIAIIGIGILVVSMLSDRTPIDQQLFEVVDTYKECDVVRYALRSTCRVQVFPLL